MSVAARRQREKQERREQILAAARTVFRERGFVAATMDQVAAVAELSKGTLYLYFSSKEELFLALSSERIGELIGELQAIGQKEESGRETVSAILNAWSEKFLADLPLFRTAMVWLHASDSKEESDSLREHRARSSVAVAILVEAIARGQNDGSIRTDIPPPQLALQVWSGMVGALMVRATQNEVTSRIPGVDFDRLVPTSLALLVDALAPGGVQ